MLTHSIVFLCAGGDRGELASTSDESLPIHESQEVRSASLRRIGALVEACSKSSHRWNNAEVMRVRKNEMVDVCFESGDHETNLPLRSIRQRSRSYDVANLPFVELPLWPKSPFALTRRRVLQAAAMAEFLGTFL